MTLNTQDLRRLRDRVTNCPICLGLGGTPRMQNIRYPKQESPWPTRTSWSPCLHRISVLGERVKLGEGGRCTSHNSVKEQPRGTKSLPRS